MRIHQRLGGRRLGVHAPGHHENARKRAGHARDRDRAHRRRGDHESRSRLNPDVITMDVEMPGMGGLEAVRNIVAHHRVPIIMCSSLTREGADTTFRALELGAVDFIAKPDAAYTNINEVARDLVAKVRTLRAARRAAARSARSRRARCRTRGRRHRCARPSRSRRCIRRARGNFECVAIGTSTGGPVALSHVIPYLPQNFPTPDRDRSAHAARLHAPAGRSLERAE